MSSVSVSTNNLSVGYGRRSVQSGLTVSLFAGEMVCILGPNGAGKSTLLRTLAGLQPALSGTFSLREASLVLSSAVGVEAVTVHDVLAMGRYHHVSFLGALSAEDEYVIADSVRMVGFSDAILPKPFSVLSDGERQRVLIAKALAQQTPVVLLDEPTAHLDLPHRISLLRLLRQLAHEQSKTVLISTHELELALQLSDRVLLLSPQVPPRIGTAAALRADDAFTEAFGMDIFHPLQP